jgi:polyisoprenoid-binding protein YceI
MKKLMLVTMVTLLLLTKTIAQDYKTSNGEISFFSEAPIANVDAKNNKVKAELDTKSQELSFKMAMADFKFKKNKMGKDAEKKYLETKKYPDARFTGKITGSVDFEKPGTYPVKAEGKLKIHGVEKEVSEKGTVTVSKGKIKLDSEFKVLLKDYHIETPSILGKEMTSDNIAVKVHVLLSEQSKQTAKK